MNDESSTLATMSRLRCWRHDRRPIVGVLAANEQDKREVGLGKTVRLTEVLGDTYATKIEDGPETMSNEEMVKKRKEELERNGPSGRRKATEPPAACAA